MGDFSVPIAAPMAKKTRHDPHSKPKAHRLTFDTTLTADEIILRTFTAKDVLQPAFPALRGSVEDERTKAWRTQEKSDSSLKPQLSAALPYTHHRFVPPNPSVVPTVMQLSQEQQAEDRAKSRREVTTEVLGADAELKEALAAPNLQSIYGALKANMSPDGTINAVGLTIALAEYEVHDVILIDDLYSKLDIHRDKKVDVSTVVKAMNDIINGESCVMIRRQCFDLLHREGTDGYLHKSYLDSLRQKMKLKDAKPGVTTMMVKAVEDVFLSVLQEEEERYLATTLKGKGRKKKKAPALPAHQKSYIPITKMRIAHIDYPTFDRYFSQSKELAAAFLPCWLHLFMQDGHLQHAVVMQRIRAAEEEAQRKQQEREANLKSAGESPSSLSLGLGSSQQH